MKRLLCITLFCGSLFGNSGVIFPSGLGLYIDAAYAPSWRGCYTKTPLVYTIRDGYAGDLGLFFQNSLFSMNQGCDESSPGIKVRADLSANRKASVEAIFYGLFKWDFNKWVSNDGGRIGFPIAPFDQGTFGVSYTFKTFRNLQVKYQEHFNSAEVNYLKHLSPRYSDYISVSLLYGVRGMQQDNKLNFSGKPDAVPGAELTDIAAQMELKNVNRLIGLQIGGIFRYRITKRMYFEFPLKGGGYGNLLDYALSIAYPAVNPNAPPSHYSKYVTNENKTRAHAAGSVEIAPHVEIHLGHMYLYVGGSYLYIGGISEAVNQIQRKDLDVTNPCGTYTIGSILAGGGIHF